MIICYFGTYEESYPRNQILIKILRKMGHSVKECHVSLWRNKIDKSQELSGILNILRLAARLLSIYPRLFVKYLFVGHHDVIFLGYFGHLDIFFAKFFAKVMFRKKKVVFDAFLSLYDSVVLDRGMIRDGSFFARLIFLIDKAACRLADFVILDTNAHIDFFHRTFGVPKEKMVRVFASADTDVFYPREVMGGDEKFNVLFMGKYIPLHGIEYIVKSADILKNDKDIRFTFIGKGQLYPKIREMVRERGLDNIRFVDWVKYEELPSYMAEADVSLGIFADSGKASRVIPNKVFQSLAMGKPVITGRTNGSNECLVDGENVLLCDVADEKALANAIVKLKEDRTLREYLSMRARETFEKEFGELAIRSSLQKVFEKI